MDNIFTKVKDAYKNSDFALKRGLKKEVKAAAELTDDGVLQIIEEDKDFADFLVGIKDPKFGTMDLDRLQNILLRPKRGDLDILKEKYVLFKQQEKAQTDTKELFEKEVLGDLQIEIPGDKLQSALELMAKALKEKAQTNTLEFVKFQNKLAEYQKLQTELAALQTKLEEKVNSSEAGFKLTGSEAIKAARDRQDKMTVAHQAEWADSSFITTKAGWNARWGRLTNGNFGSGARDVMHAVSDFKNTYGKEGAELTEEMKASAGDVKRAEKLQEKIAELRKFLLTDLKICDGLIEAAKLAAQEQLTKSLEEMRTQDRLDTMSRTDREQLRTDLEQKTTNLGLGYRGLATDYPNEQADLDRLAELKELDDLDDAENSSPGSLLPDQKTQREKLQKEKDERIKKRMAESKDRIAKMEAARRLVSKMTEGKGKKGGIDYTEVKTSTGNIKLTAKDIITGLVDMQINENLKVQLENLIKAEVKMVIEHAALNSDRLSAFTQEVKPYFEKWRIAGMDSRDKVRDFMAKTMQDLSNNPKINKGLALQMKTFLARRGLNPISFKI